MSQNPAVAGSDEPRYWLQEILAFTEDTKPLFLNDQETMRIYDVESNLHKMDESRSAELDMTRDRLRGAAAMGLKLQVRSY